MTAGTLVRAKATPAHVGRVVASWTDSRGTWVRVEWPDHSALVMEAEEVVDFSKEVH